ncbi:MAG TPA: RHS repeat-associated core domain-containing protein [Trebonia sp.]|nr:RHS repeat-associated core domain-containing protein [Trebonia sp.]
MGRTRVRDGLGHRAMPHRMWWLVLAGFHRTWLLHVMAIVGALVLVTAQMANADGHVGGPVPVQKVWHAGPVQATKSVPGHPGAPAGTLLDPSSALSAAVPYKPAPVRWPAGSGTAALPPATVTGPAARSRGPSASGVSPGKVARAGGLPVSVASADGSATAARSVSVSFASQAAAHAAGIDGVVLTLNRSDGGTAASPVDVSLDYDSFASAYGGGYASRLKLVELPACALTTPQLAKCRAQTPLRSANDTRTGVLSAQVAVSASTSASTATGGAVVMAATAGPSGSVGTYTETSLGMQGSWSAGGSTGAFTYSYPIALPPSTGGSAPDVTLSYDSESVDAKTSATSAQASAFGDGWDYSPGYIERSYQPCQEDGIADSGDNCWAGNQVTMSLNGTTITLVRDDGTGVWKTQSDSGYQVTALTGASNGAWEGEAWKITGPDGTAYYFGANLPGGSGPDGATNSTWTEPVYCPEAGDGPPAATCHNTTQGTDSVVTNMAWRWNLDYVVDPHGNLQAYSWIPETNYYDMGYAQGNGIGTNTLYDRGGYLNSIGYGYSLSAAITGAQPTDVVTFGVSQRCLTSSTFTDCSYSNLSSSTASNWPDVPFNEICTTQAATCSNYSPTFFSTYRVTSISTKVLAGSGYQPVDTYTLTQAFPAPQAGLVAANDEDSSANPGDGTTAVMWLASIQRTGEDTLGGGSAVTLPATTFTADEMPNRVDGNTYGAAALYRPRMDEITTSSGSQIVIAYSAPQCSRTGGTLPSAPDTDTMNCFPMYWTPPSAANPVLDWFNTYQVTSVTTNDLVAPANWSEASYVSYTYQDPAWHRDDSPLTPDAQRTWDQFRGFRTVTTTTGSASAQDTPTQTVTTYLQGMDGDYLASGKQRSVAITDSVGDTVTDSNWLAGQALETDTLNGVGGTVESKVVNGPWTYTTTATQAQADSMPSLTALLLQSSDTRTYQLWHDGTWEEANTATTFNATGQVASTDVSYSGDSVVPQECTTRSYATDPAANMYTYVAEVRTLEGSCASSPDPTEADTISDTLTFYDGSSTLGSLGSSSPAGDPTEVEGITGYDSSGAASYVMQSQDSYDSYGRLLSTTTADNETTTMSYSAVGASPQTVTTTNPKGWTSSATLDPGHGETISSTDVNGEVTSETYDGLGRETAQWSPLHSQASNGPAAKTITYAVTGTAPTAVSTSVLRDDGSYGTTVQLYDGQMRPIQVQSPPANDAVGRVLTDTHYNSLGQTVMTTGAYYDKTTSPDATVFIPADSSDVPAETDTRYDGMGRTTQTLLVAYGVNQYSATTSYPGLDQTDVTPPAGGTATSTFTDALGRTSATWDYTSATPTDKASNATVTSYTYTPAGKVATVRDAAGNTHSYSYNLLGQQTGSSSPDGGTTATVYSPGGEVLSTTDGNGTTLSYSYDALGRKTAEYNTTGGAPETAKNEVASWTYDTLAKDQLTATYTYTNPADGASDPTSTYVETELGYTPLYQSTGESVTIPSSQGALAGTYQSTNSYTAETSLLAGTHYYAEGSLPKEQVNYSYYLSGALWAFGVGYLNAATYTPQGQILQTDFGNYGEQLNRTETYDPATSRLLSQSDALQALPSPLDGTTYTYDDAGGITSESDTQYGVATPDTQCFTNNNLGELTAAWTTTNGVSSTTGSATAQVQGLGGCDDSAPVAGSVTGGPAAYWDSYTYDALGDRTSETSHDTSVSSNAGTTTQTLSYNGYNASAGTSTAAAAPNQVQSVTTTNSAGATVSASSYSYYPDGATKTRSGQSFTYTPQGLTASVTTAATGQASTYTYDADGSLLIQDDPAASQDVLYLPWGEQITLNTSTSTLSGLRYFTASPDGVVIVHSSTGAVYYELTNTNGTATAEVNAATDAYTFRYSDPFGNSRGVAPGSWPDQRSYLNQPQDPATGLDLLGARQYDPATGRFLSVDPVFEAGDPAQMGGYSYGADNPVNGSDPAGTMMGSFGGNNADFPLTGTPAFNNMLQNEGAIDAAAACADKGDNYSNGQCVAPPPPPRHWWDSVTNVVAVALVVVAVVVVVAIIVTQPELMAAALAMVTDGGEFAGMIGEAAEAAEVTTDVAEGAADVSEAAEAAGEVGEAAGEAAGESAEAGEAAGEAGDSAEAAGESENAAESAGEAEEPAEPSEGDDEEPESHRGARLAAAGLTGAVNAGLNAVSCFPHCNGLSLAGSFAAGAVGGFGTSFITTESLLGSIAGQAAIGGIVGAGSNAIMEWGKGDATEYKASCGSMEGIFGGIGGGAMSYVLRGTEAGAIIGGAITASYAAWWTTQPSDPCD